MITSVSDALKSRRNKGSMLQKADQAKEPVKEKVKGSVKLFDMQLLKTQNRAYEKYDKYFTFPLGLLLMLFLGASFSFVGRDCYGIVPSDSPLVVLLGSVTIFIILQIFLTIPLSTTRILRLFTIFWCSFSLAYELYGLYSIEYIDTKQACRPYAYADSAFGYFWAIVPVIVIIAICFLWRMGDEKPAE